MTNPKWWGFVILVAALGCRPASPPALVPVEATPFDAPTGPGLRVLFVGNSLTAGHDVPGMVQAMAASAGVTLTPRSWLGGGQGLEDHWNGNHAREALAATKWDFVVLQQGPSTRPESQSNLREWAGRWAEAAREQGTTPALYMVWSVRGQEGGFELVSKSYRAAAEAAKAKVFPAGEAWREALRRDPELALHDQDGLHSTEPGAYLAALVITHGLTGVRPGQIPSSLTLASGREVALPEPLAAKLREAAEVVAKP